jgi:small subunit ribosomal protein S1
LHLSPFPVRVAGLGGPGVADFARFLAPGIAFLYNKNESPGCFPPADLAGQSVWAISPLFKEGIMDDETTRAGDPLAAEPMGSTDTAADSPVAADAPDLSVPSTADNTNGAEEATSMPAMAELTAEPVAAETATEPGAAAAGEAEPPSAVVAAADEAETPSLESAAEGEAETPSLEPAAEGAAETPSLESGAAGEAETPSLEPAAEGEAETPSQEPAPRAGGGGRGGRNSQQQSNRGGYGGSGSDMAALLAESEQQFRQLKYGDVLEGRVMRKDHDEILVDIGSKSEGVIPMSELTSLTPDELQRLDIGDEVLVSVVQPENQEGHVVLSLDKARQERSWRNLQKKFEGGEILEAEVTGYNKGGLLVNLEGVRGFVPASQVSGLSSGGNDAVKQSELSRYTGQRLPLKIIEINRNRNRLILSERQAAQEQRDLRKEQLLAELQPGQIRPGTVSSICDFGAFVDIGGADGLIHLSELSWSRVNHPSEVLKVGQPVQVYVMSVDERDRKIALSLKRTQPEPWSTVMERYHLGQLVRGTITQLTDFGAFARLEDGIEGLIHVSELAEGRVTHPRNVVQEGWNLILRVIRIDPQRRRMGLSLKRAMEPQEGDTMEPQGPLPVIAGRVPAPAEAPAEGGEPRPVAPMGGGGAPRQDRGMGGGGAPRQDRGMGGGGRQDRGRRGEESEPRPQMPAQPQLETAMAAALAAAMSASEPETPALPAPGQSVTDDGPGGYLETQARAGTDEAADASAAYTQQEGTESAAADTALTTAETAEPAQDTAPEPVAFTDMQEGMAEATGPAEEAGAAEPAYTDMQMGRAEATSPAEEAAPTADAGEPVAAAEPADTAETEDGYASQMGSDETVTPDTDDVGPDTDTATS